MTIFFLAKRRNI